MNTETETTEIEKAANTILESNSENIKRYLANAESLLTFIESNRQKLLGLNWTACHIFKEIDFMVSGTCIMEGFEKNPREITKRFPGVWRREKNTTTCGVLDWVLQDPPDGIRLKIIAAETIQWSPQPNTEV